MTHDSAIEHVFVYIAKKYRGNRAAFARNNGINPQYLSLVLLGKRPISEKILTAVGLKKIVSIDYEESSHE